MSTDYVDTVVDVTRLRVALARLAPRLRAGRHVGYVNLNTIVNADGVWPLELTCRFGYPGFTILSALFAEPCGEVLARVARGEDYATHPGYAVGVVLTVPPFPYHHGYDELGKGTPILLPPDLTDDERLHLHFAEVGLASGELITVGQVGYVMVVTGRGATIDEAQRAAEREQRPVGIVERRRRLAKRAGAVDRIRYRAAHGSHPSRCSSACPLDRNASPMSLR